MRKYRLLNPPQAGKSARGGQALHAPHGKKCFFALSLS